MTDEEFRAVLPDAEDGANPILFKACSTLRLTSEIKLATYFAQRDGGRLRLIVRHDCELSHELEAFAVEYDVSVERAER